MMSCDVLCGGVHDDVSPEGEWLLVDGRGECAVNAHQSPSPVAQIGDELNVDALEMGVRRTVGIEECHLHHGQASQESEKINIHAYGSLDYICVMEINLRRPGQERP